MKITNIEPALPAVNIELTAGEAKMLGFVLRRAVVAHSNVSHWKNPDTLRQRQIHTDFAKALASELHGFVVQ